MYCPGTALLVPGRHATTANYLLRMTGSEPYVIGWERERNVQGGTRSGGRRVTRVPVTPLHAVLASTMTAACGVRVLYADKSKGWSDSSRVRCSACCQALVRV